jgi:uncharacterized lipoprotein
MTHFRALLTLLPVLMVSSLLLGCQTTFDHKTGVFRNREFDYLHQSISQRPPLQIPAGVQAPIFETKNILPAGPNQYPIENTVNMTPPGFDQVIAIPEEASPSEKVPSSPTHSSTEKTSTQDIHAQIASIQNQLNALKPTSPVKTKLSSQLGFDSNKVGLLKIQAPFNQAWEAVIQALNDSGYSITKVDKGSRVIYVDPPSTSAPETSIQHFLIFVTRKDNAVHVSVFTDKGVLDHSDASATLLTQLQAKLASSI